MHNIFVDKHKERNQMKKLILLILGIISALYGVVILGVGSGTKFWLIWEVIAGGFWLWAILIYSGFFAAHKQIKRIFYGLVSIAVISVSILGGMIGSEFSSKGKENLDYIIVLGAQVRQSGPSTILKYRLDEAIDYLNDNPRTVCIVSGGQGANEPFSEAEGMKDYLVKCGIEENRILNEDQSHNTVQNILYSKALLEETYENVGIVTNDFHVFRAVQIGKKQGLRNVYGIAAYSHPFYLPNNALRECGGILKDWIKGNL